MPTRKKIPVSIKFWETDITNFMFKKYPRVKVLSTLLSKNFTMNITVKTPEEIKNFLNAKRARESGKDRLDNGEKVQDEETFKFVNEEGNKILTSIYRFLDPTHDMPGEVSGAMENVEVSIEGVIHPRHRQYRIIDSRGRVTRRRIKRSNIRSSYTSYLTKIPIRRKDGRIQKYNVRIWRKK